MSKRFRLARSFSIYVDSSRLKTYRPGRYLVPDEMPEKHALRAAQQHAGRWISEKVSPENKVARVSENKAKVAGALRGRRSRSKSDSEGS